METPILLALAGATAFALARRTDVPPSVVSDEVEEADWEVLSVDANHFIIEFDEGCYRVPQGAIVAGSSIEQIENALVGLNQPVDALLARVRSAGYPCDAPYEPTDEAASQLADLKALQNTAIQLINVARTASQHSDPRVREAGRQVVALAEMGPTQLSALTAKYALHRKNYVRWLSVVKGAKESSARLARASRQINELVARFNRLAIQIRTGMREVPTTEQSRIRQKLAHYQAQLDRARETGNVDAAATAVLKAKQLLSTVRSHVERGAGKAPSLNQPTQLTGFTAAWNQLRRRIYTLAQSDAVSPELRAKLRSFLALQSQRFGIAVQRNQSEQARDALERAVSVNAALTEGVSVYGDAKKLVDKATNRVPPMLRRGVQTQGKALLASGQSMIERAVTALASGQSVDYSPVFQRYRASAIAFASKPVR